MARDKVSTDILWKDRKRILFLGLPWSFTRYSVSKDRFFISKGFFSVKDDEVRLYRIMDISLERSFMQRLVGVGTIIIALIWMYACMIIIFIGAEINYFINDEKVFRHYLGKKSE